MIIFIVIDKYFLRVLDELMIHLYTIEIIQRIIIFENSENQTRDIHLPIK